MQSLHIIRFIGNQDFPFKDGRRWRMERSTEDMMISLKCFLIHELFPYSRTKFLKFSKLRSRLEFQYSLIVRICSALVFNKREIDGGLKVFP